MLEEVPVDVPRASTYSAAWRTGTRPCASSPLGGRTVGSRQARQRLLPSSQVHGTPKFESLDFDINESAQCLAHKARGTVGERRLTPFLLLRWSLVVLTGFFTGVTGAAIDYLLEQIFSARYNIIENLHNSGCDKAFLALINAAMCVGLATFAGVLVCFVEPLAAGSGIPEVKCRLNGVNIPNVVAAKTYVAKAVGVLFSVAAGLPCGKEGPMIHSGAIVGGLLSELGARVYPSDYHSALEARDLITTGAAAGVTVAFGAPLGGVLFAMEEGSSFWNSRVFLRTFVGTAICELTLSCIQTGLRPDRSLPGGMMGDLGVLTFGATLESDRTTYRMWEIPLFAALGLVGGLIGATFNAANTRLTKFRMRFIGGRGCLRLLEVVLVTAVIALSHWCVPLYKEACYVPHVHVPAPNSTDYWISCTPHDTVGKGDASSIGLFIAPGEDAIKALLHDVNSFNKTILAIFWALYFVTACWTYGLGVPSGLFVPSLLVGATMGRICGQVLVEWFPNADIHPGSYALIGAGASLAGMARITISLAVILVEATGNTQWILPLLLAVSVAKWVGDFFNAGIYDIHIRLKKIPFLEPFPEQEMKFMRVADVMCEEVVALQSTAVLADLLQSLDGCEHNGFPVIDGEGRLVGTIQRSMVEALLCVVCDLQQEMLTDPMMVPDDRLEPSNMFEYSVIAAELRSVRGESPRTVAERRAVPLELSINLGPYVNTSAVSVRPDMTARMAYMLLKALGLRHLPVTSTDGHLCGMITRRDLILEEVD